MTHAVPRPPTAFAGSEPVERPKKDPAYMRWVHELPCCVCGEYGDIVAHHVRLERAANGALRGAGRLGVKVSDRQTVPLWSDLHQGFPFSLHSGSEKQWWNKRGLDPLTLCERLNQIYDSTKDVPQAIAVMEEMRK